MWSSYSPAVLFIISFHIYNVFLCIKIKFLSYNISDKFSIILRFRTTFTFQLALNNFAVGGGRLGGLTRCILMNSFRCIWMALVIGRLSCWRLIGRNSCTGTGSTELFVTIFYYMLILHYNENYSNWKVTYYLTVSIPSEILDFIS